MKPLRVSTFTIFIKDCARRLEFCKTNNNNVMEMLQVELVILIVVTR